jgi:hypothetical protein
MIRSLHQGMEPIATDGMQAPRATPAAIMTFGTLGPAKRPGQADRSYTCPPAGPGSVSLNPKR